MDAFEPFDFAQGRLPEIEEESAASLLFLEGEPLGVEDEDALPGSIEGRLLEMTSARESRLSLEADRLQRELTHSTERLKTERETESRFLRESAARAESELRAELAQERERGRKREAEISGSLQALAADHRRLKAINAVLEQEVVGAKGRLEAALAAARTQSAGLAEHNEELGNKLAALQARLEELERAQTARLTELRLQEDLVRQAHETAAAAGKRAEDAEAAARALEVALAQAEQDAQRRLEPRLRADAEAAVEAARAQAVRETEERLVHAHAQALEAAVSQAVDEAVRRTLAEREQARQGELEEAVRRSRAETETTLRAERETSLERQRREVETARDRALAALQARLEAERTAALEQAAKARAEAEMRLQEESLRRLTAAQDQARQRLEAETIGLKARLAAEHEKALGELRARKDEELASLRAQSEKEKERLEADLTRQVRREAELELNARTDRINAEWQRVKAKFEDELSRIREEVKRREALWEDEVESARRETAAVREETKVAVLRLERELLAAVEDKSRLAEAKVKAEDIARRNAEDAAAAAAALAAEKTASADAARAAKEAQQRAIDDLRKDLEGKLKALDSQLREERKKTVELLARAQRQEKSLWRRLAG